MQLASSLAELLGGVDDGEAVYLFFSLDYPNLIQNLDEQPQISREPLNNEFSVEGKFDGDDAWDDRVGRIV